MNASELRIGNYIKYSEDSTVFKLSSIEKKGFTVQGEIVTTWIESDQFEGILLTDEWFLKADFLVKEELSKHNTKMFFLPTLDIDYCFCYSEHTSSYNLYIEYTDSPFPEDEGKLYPLKSELKYVHELQNLMYALEKIELEFTK